MRVFVAGASGAIGSPLVRELAAVTSVMRFGPAFALTNRLRIEGTDHVLAAAREAGAR